MTTLIVIAALLCAGAAATLIGVWLIERAHPPRGQFIEVGGLRQHVVDLGSRVHGRAEPAVVLLHGAACNLEDMHLALGERLAKRHRVVLVDRPGLGWSERKHREGSSPAYQAGVLREVLDRLGVKRAILVGHSWGGALALRFALDYPERLAGLVLIAPPTHPLLPRSTRFYAFYGAPIFGRLWARTMALPFGLLLIGLGFRTVFMPEAPPPAYQKRAAVKLLLRPSTFLANAADVADLKGFLDQQAALYGTLQAPVIILSGDCDAIVAPKQHCMELAAAVPHAKISVLPGFGHMLHHTAPDRVIAAIEEIAKKS